MFRTELGKHVYNYSPIRKDRIPYQVLEDISSSFFTRHNITSVERVENIDQSILLFYARAEPSLQLFTEWSRSFTDFGYDAPILNFTD